MCQIITIGWCPYADRNDDYVKSCDDCPWYEPEEEEKFFEEMRKQNGVQQ